MTLWISIAVGVFFASGLYLIMRRHLFEVLLGTLLLSHAVNLFLISMGGWNLDEKPPIILPNEKLPVEAYADPLPQALILTAIVIGFGVTAFLVVLLLRGFETSRETEVGEIGWGEDES